MRSCPNHRWRIADCTLCSALNPPLPVRYELTSSEQYRLARVRDAYPEGDATEVPLLPYDELERRLARTIGRPRSVNEILGYVERSVRGEVE